MSCLGTPRRGRFNSGLPSRTLGQAVLDDGSLRKSVIAGFVVGDVSHLVPVITYWMSWDEISPLRRGWESLAGQYDKDSQDPARPLPVGVK